MERRLSRILRVGRKRIRNNNRSNGTQGHARWWLLGVMAISVLGWLWLRPRPSPPVQPSAPRVVTEVLSSQEKSAAQEEPTISSPPPHPDPAPPHSPALVSVAPSNTPATNVARVPDSPGEVVPPDVSVGAVTPFGTVVMRTNLPKSEAERALERESSFALSNGLAGASGEVWQVFQAQLMMARQGISSGSLDGKLGTQTRGALRAWQARQGLTPTGNLDAATRQSFSGNEELVQEHVVTQEELAGLVQIPDSWLGKSQLNRMDYETVLEMVSEKFQSHPAWIRTLNPSIDWTQAGVGTVVRVPKTTKVSLPSRPSVLRISLTHRTLQAFDESQRLLLHFPCSIARDVNKRPVGALRVEKVAS
ncbi:MAG: peptidoglycan-binding protein, partial [Verrucomicrobia bacterium]|nr:peptidoglycan-binding protein [Verrucomicrobiota bacterium]